MQHVRASSRTTDPFRRPSASLPSCHCPPACSCLQQAEQRRVSSRRLLSRLLRCRRLGVALRLFLRRRRSKQVVARRCCRRCGRRWGRGRRSCRRWRGWRRRAGAGFVGRTAEQIVRRFFSRRSRCRWRCSRRSRRRAALPEVLPPAVLLQAAQLACAGGARAHFQTMVQSAFPRLGAAGSVAAGGAAGGVVGVAGAGVASERLAAEASSAVRSAEPRSSSASALCRRLHCVGWCCRGLFARRGSWPPHELQPLDTVEPPHEPQPESHTTISYTTVPQPPQPPQPPL